MFIEKFKLKQVMKPPVIASVSNVFDLEINNGPEKALIS
jgi:hypothetical protein